MSNSYIKIENLSFAYEDKVILENISFNIDQNDFVGIIGPNGGGKTTLLNLMLGLLSPTKGKIEINGKSPFEQRKNIGYVPQFGAMTKHFPITVLDVVLMGLSGNNTYLPFRKKENIKLAEKTLELLEIGNLKGKIYDELSGGQQQRCLIARALVSDPEILILDEPTASVDSSIESDIFKLLSKENKKGKTIILVSHDIGFVSAYVNKVVCLNTYAKIHSIEEIEKINSDELYHTDVNLIKHKCGL